MKKVLVLLVLCLISSIALAQESSITNRHGERVIVYTYNNVCVTKINGKFQSKKTKGKITCYFNIDAEYAAVTLEFSGKKHVITGLNSYRYISPSTLCLYNDKKDTKKYSCCFMESMNSPGYIFIDLQDDYNNVNISVTGTDKELTKGLRKDLRFFYTY